MPELHKVPVIHEISVFNALAHVERTALLALEGVCSGTNICDSTYFEVSLVSQQVLKIWKTANVRPMPKQTNISPLEQLRPISVTDIIMKG